MKKLLYIFLCLLVPWVSWADIDCDYTTLSNAVSAASPGDTITCNAGSWTYTQELTVTKGISIQGGGIGITTITKNFSGPGEVANHGLIAYRPDAAAVAADNLFRLTGFTINGGGSGSYEDGCAIMLRNTSVTGVYNVRVDNNRITNTRRGLWVQGNVWGVADNNTLDDFYHGMDAEGISDGDDQWDNLSRTFGSVDNMYFEDNTLTFNNSDVGFAGGHGGRYVARYNDIINDSGVNIFPVFDMHGNQPTTITGMMINEVYGNDVDLAAAAGRVFDQRGGMSLLFYNKVEGTGTSNMHAREEYLDANYPSGNSYLMHITNSYYWGNYFDSVLLVRSGIVLTRNQYEDTYDLAENTDFWFHNTSYNGTSEIGVYAGSSLPANCATGDGAWITTQSTSDLTGMIGVDPVTQISGTLYKCTSTDTWAEYYTPYTYPHPLRDAEVPTNTITGVNIN